MESLVSGLFFKIGNRVKQVKIWRILLKGYGFCLTLIKVNGDSLSFRGKSAGRIFKSIINSSPRRKKEAFQALTDLHEIELEGKLSEPEGQRNFGGFDYQAYLKTQGIYQTLNIKKIQSLQRLAVGI